MPRSPLFSAVVLATALAASPSLAVPAKPNGAARKAEKSPTDWKNWEEMSPKELTHTITVSDKAESEVPVVLVWGGIATKLVFPSNIREDKGAVILSDKADLFFPPRREGNFLILTPKRPMRPRQRVPLTVALEDNSHANLALISDGERVYSLVHVKVEVDESASPESAQALRSLAAGLRTQLEACQQSEADAGVRKIAALIRSAEKGASFNVANRVEYVQREKDNGLLVTTRNLFRLFDTGYLALTVKNRTADRYWVFDTATIRAESKAATETSGTPLVAVGGEEPLAPDATTTIVIAFPLATQMNAEKYRLTLKGKNSTGDVELADLTFR